MEGNGSSGRIEKFSKRPSTIILREFKAAFMTVVYELELKYGNNFTNAFVFKQMACYVHHQALDVYEQYTSQMLQITQVDDPTYVVAIANATSNHCFPHYI